MKNFAIRGKIPLIGNPYGLVLRMKFLIILTLIAGFSLVAVADETDIQQITITGKVTDSQTGDFMPGVNIIVKGATVGTITDASGKYSISLPDKSAVLVFSFIGYLTKEVPYSGAAVIDVVLMSDIQNLDEVVVVGYGTQRRVTLTGSVASVSSKEIAKTPTTNVTNALAGILPGVVTKNTSGEPGRDDNVVLIRGRNTTGSTSPLVVVDGIQGVSGWERINNNDIESISVLKDASAAIYGARAANGVILITTKRGSLGKPTINFTYNQGIAQPTRIPKMASSAEFAEYVNQLDVEAGNTPRYSETDIQKFRDGTDPEYINEDWYGVCLKDNVLQSQTNLNVRGGSENIKYSISGSYTNENSIFTKGSLNYKTYSIRSNVDAVITKHLKVGFDLNGALEDGNYPTWSTSGTFGFLKQIPMVPVYWPNGLPSAGIENGINPIISSSSLSGNNNQKEYKYIAKGSFDLSIPWVKGLGVDGYFAFSTNINTGKNWATPWEVWDYNKNTNEYIMKLGGRIVTPELTESFNSGQSTLLNLRVKYEMKAGDHNLSAFIAGEQEEGLSRRFSAFRKNYLSSTIDELFAGGLVDMMTDGTRSESGRSNLFGRVSYGFMEKYLLDFNFRYDGSSNFPKGKQWGFFPGVSVAWRISEEPFLASFEPLDNLKLRGSIGKIGNDAIAAFQNLRLYTLGTTGMPFGQTQISTQGLVQGVTPNPNITWEVATTWDVGADASFWNGLISLEGDVFKQRRSNILATRDLAVPAYTGLKLPSENIGIVENKGFELQLSHAKVVREISYKVSANVAYARSKIIDIDEAQNVPEWQKAEGHVLGADKYYKAIGILRTAEDMANNILYTGTKMGDLYYEDVDKSGKIDDKDMVRIDKTNIPEVTFGANLSMNYKGFSVWANFAGATRYWQYYHVNARIAINQLQDVILNRYTPGSMTSKYPRLPTLETQVEPSGLNSTFCLMDASYLKLKTMELSYNLPEKWLSKVNVRAMRVYINGNNLFTIDKLKWNDPENSSNTNSNYPQQKVYNLGINLTF